MHHCHTVNTNKLMRVNLLQHALQTAHHTNHILSPNKISDNCETRNTKHDITFLNVKNKNPLFDKQQIPLNLFNARSSGDDTCSIHELKKKCLNKYYYF